MSFPLKALIYCFTSFRNPLTIFNARLHFTEMNRLKPLTITSNTGDKHTGTLIFLHGSGATGENMREWIILLTKEFNFPHIKIIYPTAPLQSYTPSGGLLSNVWFDRIAIHQDVPENWQSVELMEGHIRKLIADENEAGIPTNRIIIGGYSMGGALALYSGFKWEKELAGVFVLSSFLNTNSIVYQELKNNRRKKLPRFLQIHGIRDELVPLLWGQKTFFELKSCGVDGELHLLEPLAHSINKKGINTVKEWVNRVLPEV